MKHYNVSPLAMSRKNCLDKRTYRYYLKLFQALSDAEFDEVLNQLSPFNRELALQLRHRVYSSDAW